MMTARERQQGNQLAFGNVSPSSTAGNEEMTIITGKGGDLI